MAYAVWLTPGTNPASTIAGPGSGRTVGHMGSDDLLMALLRYAPMLFVVAGVAVVVWLARQRLPGEMQPDVLEALSETEALTPRVILERPPLAYQNVDLKLLEIVLEHLCAAGQVVRWYEDRGTERELVYRRVAEPATQPSPFR